MTSGSIRRILTLSGFGVLGFVGTAVVGLLLPSLMTPLQLAVYDLVYLRVGPWTADATASVVVISLASALGIIGSTLAVLVWTRGLEELDRALAVTLVGLIGLLGLEIGAIILGGEPFLVAILAVAFLAVGGLIVTYRIGPPPVVAAWVGALPMLGVLLLLLGFGLGWGGGYQLVAEPVQNGSATADFGEVPQVTSDLFDDHGDCAVTDTGYCLELRDYDHAVSAAKFMDSHGVRCPSQAAPSNAESFVATHDGQTFRVHCVGYGD